jgi:hypothetical protein
MSKKVQKKCKIAPCRKKNNHRKAIIAMCAQFDKCKNRAQQTTVPIEQWLRQQKIGASSKRPLLFLFSLQFEGDLKINIS